MASKVIVLLSGGMDSSTLLFHHIQAGDEVRAIGVNYGQRHNRELEAAKAIADAADIPFTVVDLSALAVVLPGSSQTDRNVEVPEGHYSEENMKATVVPNRNMILLSIAIGHAIAHGFESVSYAAHAGDHAIYPDCRPEFAKAMEDAAKLCDWTVVSLQRPFVNISKADIVKLGWKMGVPFQKTWSCYKGKDVHCGRCGTCVERKESFYLANVVDPTEYDPSAPTVEQLIEKNWHP